ncbi:MAG: Ig-like domain-containing protein, partial [Acidimicrobiia bacterium]
EGFGFEDPATGTVGCREAVEGSPGNRLETWVPITDGSTYYEAFFSEVWSWIGGEGHPVFPSTCECDTLQDNGAGISWQVTVPAGGSVVLSHLTSFSPGGTVPLSTSKTADSPTSAPGGTNGYTITVSNPNDFTAVLDSIVDFLPGGFSYVDGSTTGVTNEDPSIGEGPTLTWSGSFEVPPNSSINLHFSVTVADAPGEYFNEASATAGSLAVASSGPTAPITVEDGNQPPVAMDDSASTAQDTSVNIDVLANDSDPDEDDFFISNVSEPGNGSAFVDEDGTIRYTPFEGFTGTDTFTYTASDGSVDSNVATVTVLVGEVASCEVEGSEGCTATTDDGMTGPDNPVSVEMTVPPGQPAGVYAIREIDQSVPNPAGAFEYIAPEGATIFIEVRCDESQCPRFRPRRTDLTLTVIKENEDGTTEVLARCRRTTTPPCVVSVVRDRPPPRGTGDLIWTVRVFGEDPKAGGAR